MHRFITPFVAAGMAVAMAPMPGHADPVLWKQSGDWEIAFYQEDHGCSAYAEFVDGTGLYLGLVDADADLHVEFLVFNLDWQSIEQDEEYAIQLRLDDGQPWDLAMFGIRQDGVRGLSFHYPAETEVAGELMGELMGGSTVELWYLGTSLARLSLTGSARAYEEVVACTRSYRDAVMATADPFAADDPFSSAASGGGDPFR